MEAVMNLTLPSTVKPKAELLPVCVMEAEARFYQEYAWCLNSCIIVRDAVKHLDEELVRLDTPLENWQRGEVLTNVYLLACALLNAVEDDLRGPVYQMPRLVAWIPLARLTLNVVEKLARWKRAWRNRRMTEWRQRMIA